MGRRRTIRERRINLIRDASLTALALIGFLLCTVGWNWWMNDHVITKPGLTSTSKPTGLSGHREVTIYDDGTADLKHYPGLGHRFFDSTLYQETTKDCRIDRIRKNSSEMKMNRLETILVRTHDLDSHRKEFDEGDAWLADVLDRCRNAPAK